MNLRKKLKLYVITDRRLRPEVESVKEALEGGATSIQLRIKNAPTREMIEIGKEIRKLTEEYDALYFVDDRLDVALATNADGVQLGSEDMPISIAKEIAPNLIIGASVYSLEEALQAEKEGADYLGAGSVFPTPTKKDVKIIGIEGLSRIVESVKIPVVAIGGIKHENVREVLKAGVDGIAVISAIMGAENVREATERMRKIIEEVIG
ncbi:thiamine-phosphate pyrophosphorylase [Thermococcus litoralis DSM 5473]|uniref:Thiamine-phosphate synthase n=1 Tax=Thermococcus litoralis (strain ATCC 51850 / DSM 5473 / JCM 8560 / NS-C) TaxID=523849 RepID=H3ZJJ7_THELN|nr:thiamine phosphate synthase [Thermococcus litoralis]EHR79860.1 thiamine-phosphate pyrophosphorylase [Thermococcus litoralis DSM 5473]